MPETGASLGLDVLRGLPFREGPSWASLHRSLWADKPLDGPCVPLACHLVEKSLLHKVKLNTAVRVYYMKALGDSELKATWPLASQNHQTGPSIPLEHFMLVPIEARAAGLQNNWERLPLGLPSELSRG